MASRKIQYISMFSGCLLPILSGINEGWSSPYLPLLSEDNSAETPLKLNSNEAFWCSIIPLLGSLPGDLAAALLVDRIGRKYILITLSPIAFISMLAIGFTNSFAVLIVARFFLGFVEGASNTVLPMYLGEIADPQIRGVMSSSISFSFAVGMLLINAAGSYISIFTSSMIFSVFPLIHLVTFLWMPRSPYYLAKRGLLDEGERSLGLFRGVKDVHDEFKEIVNAVERQESNLEIRNAKYTDLFTEPGNRKAVMIYLILCFATAFSGLSPLTIYAHSIFAEADGFLSPELSVIILRTIALISTVAGIAIVDKLGRRPLILFSSFISTLAMSVFAAYLTMQFFDVEVIADLTWLPLVSLVVFFIALHAGLIFGQMVFVSELFPTSVKGYACGSGDTITAISATITSKIFDSLSYSYGMFVPFWLFAISSLIGAVLLYSYLPETKGKTLERIQLELLGYHKSAD